jgi:hypothetical protein
VIGRFFHRFASFFAFSAAPPRAWRTAKPIGDHRRLVEGQRLDAGAAMSADVVDVAMT